MSDRDLQDLKRRLEAEPNDAGLALKFERALLRAGRDDEVVQRYIARYACDLSWSALEEDPRSPAVRYCSTCEEGVRLVRDGAELDRYVEDGQRVAGSEALLHALAGEVVIRLKQGIPPDRVPGCFVRASQRDLDDSVEAQPGCSCLEPGREARFHREQQDTDCAPWKRLLELVDDAARDGREEFAPANDLGWDDWSRIVTLPASIAKLTSVRHLMLYGSNLVRIPPQVGAMTSLEKFTPYTSYRLHWFPYEITRCLNLRDSTVSTRAIYGNYKYRPPFPALERERGPIGSTCSVCGRAAGSFRQAWISLRVATDVLPLLVNACSLECLQALPESQGEYVQGPHRGGLGVAQPDGDAFYA